MTEVKEVAFNNKDPLERIKIPGDLHQAQQKEHTHAALL